jgi:predicted nucleic acid-binding protein
MGLTVLDAGVLIGFLDGRDAHHAGAHRLLTASLAANDTLALPASALAEVLVGPSRRGPEQVAVVHRLVEQLPVTVVPLDAETATVAARLRAAHRSLRLPDALVIATAVVADADQLVTTDRKWPTRARLGLRAELRRLTA